VDSVVSDPIVAFVTEDVASEVVDGDFVVGASVPEDPGPLPVASVALETSLSFELKILLVISLSDVVIGTDG